jgi:hypothetical protein
MTTIIVANCNSITIARSMRQSDALRRATEMRRNNGLREDPRDRWRAWEMHQQTMALRACAANAFATLNGWRRTRRAFRADTLARHGCHDASSRWGCPSWPHALFDHPVYFRELQRPYRAAAVIGQPYGTSLETARELAAELGLIVHAPPNLTASWWYPGHARLFVVTRPDVSSVQFLPDQQIVGGQP